MRTCGAARAMRSTSSCGIESPVGLLGLVRKISRVSGVTAAITSSRRKSEIGARRHFDDACADAVGRRRVHVESGHDDDRLRALAAAIAQRRNRQRQDALVEPVRQHELVLGDADPRRRQPDRRVIVRVEGDVLSRYAANRREHLRRAAGGVLVEMQPQARRRPGDDLVLVAHDVLVRRRLDAAGCVRTRIECA